AARSLALDTSKFQLLPSNQPWATLYQDYSRDFAQLEDIVVAVQSPSVETSAAYAARLERELRVGELRSARVTYRIDPRHLAEHGLLYLAPDAGYFLSEDRRLLYVVVDFPGSASTLRSETEAISALRRVITALRAEFPAVTAGVTGAPALFSDELATATRDTGAATVLALVL